MLTRRKAALATYDIEKERATMERWISSYLQDAGYHTWLAYPDVFKVVG